MKRFLSILITTLLMLFLVACGEDEAPTVIPVDDKPVEVIKAKTYRVAFAASEGGYISGTDIQEVKEGGSSKVVKAVANEGYEFVSWNDGSKDEKKIVDNVSQDAVYVATFRKIIYEYPSIFIVTEGYKNVTSKETYLNCTITVDDHKNPEYSLDRVDAKIKGRGNSTWDKPKKPYRIKFNKKVDLFGNGANKDWTLIANYVDPSLIRNYLAYSIGERFDHIPFTTSTQFTKVYLNGNYQGLYLVCEQIETGKNRVEIDDSLNDNVSFLLELDYRILDEGKTEGLDYFKVEGQPYGIKAPKTDEEGFTTTDCAKIKSYLELCMNIVKNRTYVEVCAFLDVDTFADGYIIHELFSSIDVNFSSWYICKDKDSKLMNGPIWDFDISAGNVDYNDQARYSNKLFASNNTWYKYLLKFPEFKALVKEKLIEYYGIIRETIDEKIAEVMIYQDYFEENFLKWKILGKYEWPNPPEIVAINTWVGQVEFVREWLFKKLDYMFTVYCV